MKQLLTSYTDKSMY